MVLALFQKGLMIFCIKHYQFLGVPSGKTQIQISKSNVKNKRKEKMINLPIYLKLPKLTMPLQLIIVLVSAGLFGGLLPQNILAIFYSISLTLKGLLLFILPLLIFSCLFLSFSVLRSGKAIKFILILFIFVCISNYIATLVAYGVASLKITNIDVQPISTIQNKELIPLWNFEFHEWIPNNYALCLGFMLGYLFSFLSLQFVNRCSICAKQFVEFFLNKIFAPLLPLFVLGFILKMQFDGILINSIKHCLPLSLLIILTYLVYIAFLFAVAANFNFVLWKKYIKNVISPALTGFSTMSSLATMPLTINAAEKNTGDSDISHVVIPATVNIHMIGLAINIPLMALSILLNFGYELPTFIAYSTFAFYFVLTQFAGAGAPGCGILLMIPLLESYFGFTGEMSAFIIALYILFDAAETSANVLGNSVLVIIVSKIYSRM